MWYVRCVKVLAVGIYFSGPDGRVPGSRKKTPAERKFCKSLDNKKQYAKKKAKREEEQRELLLARKEVERLQNLYEPDEESCSE